MLNLVFDKWSVDGYIPNGMDDNLVNYIMFTYQKDETIYNHMSNALEKTFGKEFNIWNDLFGIILSKNLIECTPYDPNKKNWIYAIEPWGHLSYSCNLFVDERGGGYKNFFKNIPEKIKKDINDDNGKLVINYSHEGWVNNWLLKNLYLGIKNSGISTKNSILILNDFNLEEKVNKFILENGIDKESFPKIINYSYYIPFSSFFFYNKYKKFDINKYFKNKTHKFLFLNRRLEVHKLKVLLSLYENIKTESIISYDKALVSDDVLFEFTTNLELKNKFDSIPDKIIADIENLNDVNGYKDENSELYEKSLFSIVTETNFYNENDFISEKIFKPLWHMQPFIVVGRPYMLKYLKELGFKTFDWLIDETYDTIEDNEERMKRIIFEIEKINKLDLTILTDIIQQNYNTLEHNRNVILNIGNNISKIEHALLSHLNDFNDIKYVDLIKNIKYEKGNLV